MSVMVRHHSGVQECTGTGTHVFMSTGTGNVMMRRTITLLTSADIRLTMRPVSVCCFALHNTSHTVFVCQY